MADRARQKTDKRLANMEKEMGRIYRSDPALKRVYKKYKDYMSIVNEKTKDAYNAYKNETDTDKQRELKKAYGDEVKKYTLDSKKYKEIIDEFTDVMAKVNQEALDIVNDEMVYAYTVNYNQVAVDCKKVGIEVDGEEQKV